MEVLKFNEGFKEIAVNGDKNRVIRFNPSDFGIIDRLNNAIAEIDKIANSDKLLDFNEAQEIDKTIRNIINGVFASDVCTPAFGSTNCLSLAGGQMLFMNFLEAMVPLVEQACKDERKKSEKKISKYTSQIKK